MAGLAAALLIAAARDSALLRAPSGFALGLFDRVAASAGLAVAQVSLVGNRHAASDDLLDIVERVVGGGSTLSLHLSELRNRLEQHAWVAAAHVALELPDHLIVSIVERKPVAVWQHEGRSQLLDADGRVLGPAEPGLETLLVGVAGAGAAAASGALLARLGETPSVARRMLRAVRIGERRWSLELDGGVRVELPERGERDALLAVEALVSAGFTPPLLDMRLGVRRAIVGGDGNG
jgi:cell division protein FtsQ